MGPQRFIAETGIAAGIGRLQREGPCRGVLGADLVTRHRLLPNRGVVMASDVVH